MVNFSKPDDATMGKRFFMFLSSLPTFRAFKIMTRPRNSLIVNKKRCITLKILEQRLYD